VFCLFWAGLRKLIAVIGFPRDLIPFQYLARWVTARIQSILGILPLLDLEMARKETIDRKPGSVSLALTFYPLRSVCAWSSGAFLTLVRGPISTIGTRQCHTILRDRVSSRNVQG